MCFNCCKKCSVGNALLFVFITGTLLSALFSRYVHPYLQLNCDTDQYPLNGYHTCSFAWITFQGYIRNSKREGMGYLNSTILWFEGQWKDDKRNGYGYLEFYPTWYEYEGTLNGTWVDDKVVGIAKLTMRLSKTSHMIYRGPMKDSLMEGKGELQLVKHFNTSKELIDGTLWGTFSKGKLVANKHNKAKIVIPVIEKSNEKTLQEVDHYFVIESYKDGWLGGYSCNASLRYEGSKLNPKQESFLWNGYDFSSKNITADEKRVFDRLKDVLVAVRNFELYWLTKQLVIHRENFDLYKLVQDHQRVQQKKQMYV